MALPMTVDSGLAFHSFPYRSIPLPKAYVRRGYPSTRRGGTTQGRIGNHNRWKHPGLFENCPKCKQVRQASERVSGLPNFKERAPDLVLRAMRRIFDHPCYIPGVYPATQNDHCPHLTTAERLALDDWIGARVNLAAEGMAAKLIRDQAFVETLQSNFEAMGGRIPSSPLLARNRSRYEVPLG